MSESRLRPGGPEGAEVPFFFGPGAELYGCLHRPEPAGDCGIVTCYPLGPEYNRSHRAIRRLAIRLAGAGFPVLRFDYYGAGDSKGTAEQAWVPRWIDDVGVAIDTLRQKTAVSRVALVGLRLGATLATLASRGRDDVDGLALWDPVVRGAGYLAELRELAARPLWGVDGEQDAPAGVPGAEAAPPDPDLELLGLPMNPDRYRELADLDLLQLPAPPAERVLLIQTGDDQAVTELAERWRGRGARSELERIPGPEIWKDDEGALMPMDVLERITSWFAPPGS